MKSQIKFEVELGARNRLNEEVLEIDQEHWRRENKRSCAINGKRTEIEGL
jgi:hypothetical protein